LKTACVQHHEEALRLCRHYGKDEYLPDILYGLCEAYRLSKDYVKAYTTGQEALRLYQDRMDQKMEARMHNNLGHLCRLLGNYNEAAEHLTDSLAIAASFQESTIAMLDCAALAELRLAQGRLPDAKRYRQLALENMERSKNRYMRGVTYQSVGKVTHAEAQQAEGTQRVKFLEEAASWFEKALAELLTTQAYPDIAEVYGNKAQVLEDLGRTQDAIQSWRSGYEALSHTTEGK
jgi:tetratricopeptide (TPR) repeat protein